MSHKQHVSSFHATLSVTAKHPTVMVPKEKPNIQWQIVLPHDLASKLGHFW